ncbi:MAG: hypothetical protein OWS74_04515, partial [Firmicutes bacterium]|nr:hypothetical protein [Bacillota bacterium]
AGHSEGALIALYAQVLSPSAGLIALTPPTLVRSRLLWPLLPPAQDLWSRLLRLSRHNPLDVLDAPDSKKSMSAGFIQNMEWLSDHLALKPWQTAARITEPVCIIAGGKDLQCPPGTSYAFAHRMQKLATVHLLHNLTHVLRADPEPPSLHHYPSLTKNPVDDRLAPIISAFCTQITYDEADVLSIAAKRSNTNR